MKKMRLPLIIYFSIAVIGVVVGSFFDYEISSAVASTNNAFALAVSMVGPTIGWCGITFIGGGFIALAVKRKYNLPSKIAFYALAALTLALSVYFAGPEYFGVNGLNMSDLEWVGYPIVILPFLGAGVGGYFTFKDSENEGLWIVFVVTVVVLILMLGVGVNVLKSVMHRPRYRTVSVTEVPFYNWWVPCTGYKDYMQAYGLASEEFKSFPSGHTAYASLLLVPVCVMPLGNKKTEKYQLPVFFAAFAFVMLAAFCSILVAAHYLSDVSFGAVLSIISLIIINEILIRIKKVHE